MKKEEEITMSLANNITQDIKQAMKEGEKVKLSVLRMLKAAIKNKEIDLRKTLSDEEILGVIRSMLKKSNDSIAMFEKGDRQDLVDKEKAEAAVISSYLPKALSREETESIVKAVIKSSGASSIKDMGSVMKEAIAKTEGRADGKLLSGIVRTLLAEG